MFKFLQFSACAAGIYISYLTQGIIQEKLSTETFGPQAARSKNMAMLSLVQGFGCLVIAYVLTLLTIRAKNRNELPPLGAISTVGISAAVGPSLGYSALKNINYSAQVIVKSSKVIPIMLVGAFLYGQSYNWAEWAVMLMLCGGLGIFSWKSSPEAISKLSSPNLFQGYLLCAMNLLCDGYTNSKQDAINSQYSKNPPIYMMFATNLWLTVASAALLLIGDVLGWTSAYAEFAFLFLNCPKYAFYILQFCLCGAVGQLFIFWTIKSYGSVMMSTMTTTRKFFSILLSVFWNGTPLLPLQWLGVALFFAGVIGNSYIKNEKHKKKQKSNKNASLVAKKKN